MGSGEKEDPHAAVTAKTPPNHRAPPASAPPANPQKPGLPGVKERWGRCHHAVVGGTVGSSTLPVGMKQQQAGLCPASAPSCGNCAVLSSA